MTTDPIVTTALGYKGMCQKTKTELQTELFFIERYVFKLLITNILVQKLKPITGKVVYLCDGCKCVKFLAAMHKLQVAIINPRF